MRTAPEPTEEMKMPPTALEERPIGTVKEPTEKLIASLREQTEPMQPPGKPEPDKA